MPRFTPPTDPPGPARPDVVMPFRAMEAISHVSAVLGRKLADSLPRWKLGEGPEHSVVWGAVSGTDRNIAKVEWWDDVLVTLNPETDAERRQADEIVEWCSSQGIAWKVR